MTTLEIVQLIKTSKAKKFVEKHDIEDEHILATITEVNQAIKNYCCVTEVPAALSYTVANMVVDLLLYEAERNGADQIDLDLSKVDTLNIGDTTIKFANDKMKNSERQVILGSHSAKLDGIVMNYRQQLNLFRRLF